MKNSTVKLGLLAAAMLASLPSLANSVVINFDSNPSGSLADLSAPSDIHFFDAYYVNDVIDGAEIPNTEKYQIDPEGRPVLATNPLANNYGAAPSGTNALNALDAPVLLQFDIAKNLTSFSTIIDNSQLGSGVPESFLYFLGANKEILAQVAFNDTVPGALISLNAPVNGVKDVLFSSGAFYDNITISTNEVPVPPALPLMASALAIFGLLSRKKKNRSV